MTVLEPHAVVSWRRASGPPLGRLWGASGPPLRVGVLNRCAVEAQSTKSGVQHPGCRRWTGAAADVRRGRPWADPGPLAPGEERRGV
jgi:hypothetical protein